MRTIDTLTHAECKLIFHLAFGHEPDEGFEMVSLSPIDGFFPAQTTITDSRLALHLYASQSIMAVNWVCNIPLPFNEEEVRRYLGELGIL